MSRLTFRAAVPGARPISAWLLVFVAATTLWITGQIAIWASALQATAILFSLATRARPRAWQTRPLVLNLGMFGLVAASVGLAIDGRSATVCLAHFAAMAQGLQLLDARPRRTEFLLVALALFQVILAANLTDSVLFPPLLAIFLVATTWTLLVHTLRTEAIEAGDSDAAALALRGGLVQMTAVASLASLAMAGLLFIALPRLPSSLVQSGILGSRALAGFSDRVELGTLGRIRKDPSVVLRVETLEGTPPAPSQAYWRGLAFDAFDGRRWSVSPLSRVRHRNPVAGSPRLGVDLPARGSRIGGPRLVQRVTREPVAAGVVFGMGTARRIEGTLNRLEIDGNGGLYAPGQDRERVRYTLWSDPRTWSDVELRADRAAAPRRRSPRSRDDSDRFTALPELDPQVHALARAITRQASTDADRLRALELALRARGRYTDSPPDLGGGDRSPVEDFLLGDLAGHCEYFASGMVILARSLGFHARLVNGFAGGRRNAVGGFTELAASDAHAWVEVHYQKAGWVRYDPTPPDRRLRAAGSADLLSRLADLGSALELWWFERVVDFDGSDQASAVRGVLAAWRSWRLGQDPDGGATPSAAGRESRPLSDVGWRSLALAAAALVLAGLWRRRQTSSGVLRTPGAYGRALRILARRGLRRSPTTTARRFAQLIADAHPSAASAFACLTEDYLGSRFGERPHESPEKLKLHLTDLKQSLREQR